MYYLYLKQHNETGLKYLGYTKREDYEKYTGSGIYWKRHLKKYGLNVSTKILGKFDNTNDLKEAGLYYSKQFNVVESKEFANLKTEEGVSGGSYSEESRLKMSIAAKKRGAPKSAWTSEDASKLNKKTWQDPEVKKRRSESISKALKGVKRGPQSEETKEKKRNALKGRALNKGMTYKMKEVMCPHCSKKGKGGNMTRYHFDNCKDKNPFGEI